MGMMLRILLTASALAAGAGALWSAQESGAQKPAVADNTPVRGKLLLLQTERALEGDIEKVGDRYRIRRGAAESWVPADKVLRLCADWDDAYVFLKARSNLGDPDERLRLARWCDANGLRDQALMEARYALEMRPGHPETKRLVASLERLLNQNQENKPRTLVSGPAPDTNPPQVDISSDSFALFATRVQPILMNTCVHCHSGGRGGTFQLQRTYDSSQRGPTQRNLAAVLPYLNLERSEISPLLVKAVSAHGGGTQPPIKNRQAIPFRTLEAWTAHVVANNPHLRQAGTSSFAAGPKYFAENATPTQPGRTAHAPPEPPREFAVSAKPTGAKASPAVTAPAPVVAPPATPQPEPKIQQPTLPSVPESDTPQLDTPPPAAGEAPNPADPFDPTQFNRQHFPKR